MHPGADNPELGANPKLNEDIHYGPDLQTQVKCPFAAHTRKTNSRNDLDDTTQFRIMRRGMPFGEEISQEEIREERTMHNRGLIFVAYQSNISKGFQFHQKSKYFPESIVFPLLTYLSSRLGKSSESSSATLQPVFYPIPSLAKLTDVVHDLHLVFTRTFQLRILLYQCSGL